MPLIPPAEAVIFDFDGVIIDSLRAVESAINGALAAHGFAPRAHAEIGRFIGPPTLSAFAELTGAAESSPTVAEESRPTTSSTLACTCSRPSSSRGSPSCSTA